VKEFKEEIKDRLEIPAELQKLIFCGRVLQDDKRLNEYGVNEKVVHLVKKQANAPPGQGPPNPNQFSQSSRGRDQANCKNVKPKFLLYFQTNHFNLF
jgi:hypothetical protein